MLLERNSFQFHSIISVESQPQDKVDYGQIGLKQANMLPQTSCLFELISNSDAYAHSNWHDWENYIFFQLDIRLWD